MQQKLVFPPPKQNLFCRAVLSKRTLSLFLLVFIFPAAVLARQVYSPTDYLKTKRCAEVSISPNGEWIAYTVSSIRGAGEKAGLRYSELYLVSVKTGEIRSFITGKVNVHHLSWSPEGTAIAFLRKKTEKDTTQVWLIPAFGGEAVQVTDSETDVLAYHWHPDGSKIAYVAVTAKTEREKQLKGKGYEFIFYEENLKHRNLYLCELPGETGPGKVE